MLLEEIPEVSGRCQQNVPGVRLPALRGRSARARILRGSVLMVLTGIATGCYSTVPAASAPTPGQVLVMELNDNGRVALGPSIGASATKVEGMLESRTDSAYTVKVRSVVYMNGSNQRWTDEPLTIRTDLVRELRERKFSPSRTALFAAGSVGAVVAFIATRSLLDLGTPERERPPGEGNEQ